MNPTRPDRGRTAAAALLLAIITAGPLRAAEDGGTRSYFSYGAGVRALSMGGAFAAVSDDASAAIWNPGGLGWVPRREFQASRTRLFGLTAIEDYASLVLPSWRLGAASLTIRRLSVDGIEGRDERNNLIDDGLSLDHTEILLGYGRGIAEALKVGATLKLRRYSLAGYSANGFGSDLGIALQPGAVLGADGAWSQGLTAGIALQNLVSPSLRLDRDAVNDPLTTRAGLAYRARFGRGGGIVTALDLEHSAHMQPRLHTGVELSLSPLLSLRAGWRPEAPSAGVGIRWRGIAAEYLIEDGNLGALQRAGLSWAFGPTIEEGRLEARRAQERALEESLTEAFSRREEERTHQLLAAVEANYQRGLHDEALEQLALLQALSPGLEAARIWEVRCWKTKAEQLEGSGDFAGAALAYSRVLSVTPGDSTVARSTERCRRESDLRSRRSEEFRRQFAQALDAFSVGDLRRAREGFAAIRSANPDDQEAVAMLDRTDRAIEKRVTDLLDQARRYTRSGLLSEADAALGQIRALDPRARGLASAEGALAQERAKARSAVPPAFASTEPPVLAPPAMASPAAAERKAISAQQRKEAEDLYQRGLSAMRGGKNAEAVRYWELVYSIDPDHVQVRDHLKREYLMVGMDAFADGRLEEAVGLWQKALRIDPQDEKAKGYLARAEEQLSRTREILGTRPREARSP